MPASLKLLAEYFWERGYRTLAITGGGYVHPRYQWTQGFNRFWYWSSSNRLTRNHEIGAALRRASTWLEEHAHEPFFLFFHTYDIHHILQHREPYIFEYSELESVPKLGWSPRAPRQAEDGYRVQHPSHMVLDGHGGIPLPEELASLPADVYDSRIAYLDDKLRILFAQLDALSLSERTIVVLTSDHGEMLGEHGLYGHHYLYDENLMVPLIIAAPGVARHAPTVEQQVRSIDIVPTILDLLGIPPDPQVEGRSLRELMETGRDRHRRPGWSYASKSNYGMSVRLDNRRKLIFNNTLWSPIHGDVELYKIDQDPGETVPVGDPNESERLRRLLVEEYLQAIPGLHMTFHNPGPGNVQYSLAGPIVGASAAKSVDLECDCVRLRKASKRIDVTVPAAARFTLIFEDVETGPQPIVITAVEAAAAPDVRRAVIDPAADLVRPLALAWTASGWRRSGAAPTGSVASILVRWQAKRFGDAAPEEADEELRQRLQALGYL